MSNELENKPAEHSDMSDAPARATSESENEPVEHKKVELVELFFDLVMVYAVSKTTGVIHHLNGQGMIAPFDFFSFLVAFVIIVNAWTYQAVFTNRYGSNSPRDMTFSFIGMGLLLFLSNTITSDWESAFYPFTMCLGLVFVVQFVQYLVTYVTVKTPDDRFLIRGFLLLTGIYAAALLIGAQLPYEIGIWFSMVGLAINLTLPLVFNRRLHSIPLNFPHLVERFTLFVIITFGEMVVGIAEYFTVETLSLSSVLVFVVAVSLFVYYILQLDYMMDVSKPRQGVWVFQYAHLPIFFGLGMTTVSFIYLLEPEANSLFVVLFLYAGLLLFYLGVYATHGYNLPQFATGHSKALSAQVVILVASFVLSLVFMDQHAVVLGIAAVGTTLASAILFRFYWVRRTVE